MVKAAGRVSGVGFAVKPAGDRYRVGVDFDGVIHSYVTPWISAEVIPDPPVEGSIEWLNEIGKKFDIAIITTRGSTPQACAAVKAYLREHGCVVEVVVTDKKLPCLVYVDDRGWRFEGPGSLPSADEIHRARPWYKR